MASEPARDVAPAVREVRSTYTVDHPTFRQQAWRLLFEPGERHDLTTAQRLRGIALWTCGGILGLALLGIILTELASLAARLFQHRPV